MNEEEKKALRVINTRTRRLLDELEIEKENMSDELRIAYLMQEIRANKTILNLIEKLQKENEELKEENEYNKILLDMNNNFTIDKKTGNYKWNVIEIQKVKDKIRHYQELQDNYIKKYDEINEGLQAMINVLQELIEEREEN